MSAAFLIAEKDLRQRLRDRSAIMLALVIPLGLAFIFNLIIGGATEGDVTFRYALVDGDHGPVAGTFVDEVLGSLEDDGLVRLVSARSIEQGRRLAEDGDVDATFVIPTGFSEAVQGQRASAIRVIGNVDAQIATQVARAVAEGFAGDLNGVRVAVATVLSAEKGGRGTPAPVLAARAASTRAPIGIDDVSAATRELDADTFFAAGMAVFFLFFTVQFGVSSLLEERNDGTLSRLLAAPVSRASILGGKLLTSFVLGVVSMTGLVVATSLLMGATWGDPLGVAVLILAGVLSAIAIMAVIATLARSAELAGNWQAIIAVILGLLGGTFFPIAEAGGVIAKLSLLTPHAWFLRGLADLAGGGGVGSVLPAAAAILAFAAVAGAIALLRLGRMVRP
jgi:ABC-2 type transport system permease protein